MLERLRSGKELVLGAGREFALSPRKGRWIKLKIHMLARKIGLLPAAQDGAGYLAMQKAQYDLAASIAQVKPGEVRGDYVAAMDWPLQNRYPDYENYILKYVPKDASWVALEYGCGPGRNLRNWASRFQRIDGVDISAINLGNAKTYCADLPESKRPRLFLTQGADVGDADKNYYDFCFSVICLQHISLYEVRRQIFASIFSALKSGGRLAFQMGFSTVPISGTVEYLDNYYQAPVTNGGCDVRVASADQLIGDLKALGFVNIEATVRPVSNELKGVFPEWIFVNAAKP